MRRIHSFILTASLAVALAGSGLPVLAAVPEAAPVLTTPQVVRAAGRSIVRIEVEGAVEQTVTTGEGPGAKVEKVDGYEVSFGTGFVIDDAGHVVTNNHVVHPAGVQWKGTPRLTVELPKDFNPRPASFHSKAEEEAFAQIVVRNGRAYVSAPPVVGSDEAADLAVVQIPGRLLKPLKFARPENIEVGEDVVAVGFALGMTGAPSVTKGVVSATGRSLSDEGIEVGDLIQTDAAINHGNSGGPLLDMHGDVIGVNTYTMAGDGENLQTQGVYLARSSRTAARYVEALIRDGEVARATLGVEARLVGLADARAQDIAQGVVVTDVAPDSAADEARLPVGAMIVRIGGLDVQSLGDLDDALAVLKPGQAVEVEYRDYHHTMNPPTDKDDFSAKLVWAVLSGLEKNAAPKTVHVVLK